MLTPAENERLTQVTAGTPAGNLLRRYWHPIAAVDELVERWTKRVRLLGEDLVLFKDRSGHFGLIGEACPHRRASLAYGIPTAEGIRCPYHGWMFDGSGRCLEQPNEPEGSNFKDKVTTAGYPVEALGGLVFAYLGPAPAPQIPRLEGFVADRAIRLLGSAVVPCNWLQIMENSVDPIHSEWLHGHFAEFVAEATGAKYSYSRKHVKVAFDEVDYGIVKRRLMVGQDENCDDWQIGHPVVFPNILALGSVGNRARDRQPADQRSAVSGPDGRQRFTPLLTSMGRRSTVRRSSTSPRGSMTPRRRRLTKNGSSRCPLPRWVPSSRHCIDANGEYLLDITDAQDLAMTKRLVGYLTKARSPIGTLCSAAGSRPPSGRARIPTSSRASSASSRKRQPTSTRTPPKRPRCSRISPRVRPIAVILKMPRSAADAAARDCGYPADHRCGGKVQADPAPSRRGNPITH